MKLSRRSTSVVVDANNGNLEHAETAKTDKKGKAFHKRFSFRFGINKNKELSAGRKASIEKTKQQATQARPRKPDPLNLEYELNRSQPTETVTLTPKEEKEVTNAVPVFVGTPRFVADIDCNSSTPQTVASSTYGEYPEGYEQYAGYEPTVTDPAEYGYGDTSVGPQTPEEKGYYSHRQVMDIYYQEQQNAKCGKQQPHEPNSPPRRRRIKRASLDTALTMINEPVICSASSSCNDSRSSSRFSGRAIGRGRKIDSRRANLNYSRDFLVKRAGDMDREANEMSKNGEYEKAFMLFEKALKLKRIILQVDPEAGQTLQHEENQIKQRRTKKHSKKDNKNITEEQESEMAGMLASVATSINNMTFLRQRGGQASADETMAAYIQALQIKRTILGPDHLSVGKTLSNIGSVFYTMKEYSPALKAFEKALEIMTAQMGPCHLEVGTVLSNIADVYFAMKNNEKALEFYKRAIDVRWVLGKCNPKVVRLLKRAALLQMGNQPEKDDFSDSDDEEYAAEEAGRRKNLHNDMQALREEVNRDICDINLKIFNQRSSSLLPKDDEDHDRTEKLLSGEESNATHSPSQQRQRWISLTQGQFDPRWRHSVRNLECTNIGEENEEVEDKSTNNDDSDGSMCSAPPDVYC